MMEKSAKNEKSPWIKSRKKPGPKKKGKTGFSEDRKRNLAASDKGSWFDQETLVNVEGSVESDHEELKQRPSTSSTVIGSSTQSRAESNVLFAVATALTLKKFQERDWELKGFAVAQIRSVLCMIWQHHSTQPLKPTDFTTSTGNWFSGSD